MIRLAAIAVLVLLSSVVVLDSRFHLDQERVELKQKARSDQRSWSIYYSQEPVYTSAGLRYRDDFLAIETLVEQGSVVLSDLATSYHAAAELPVYVLNVHRHHGRFRHGKWRRFIDARYLCYLDQAANQTTTAEFLAEQTEVKYVLVNHDRLTSHRNQDCLAFRSDSLAAHLPQFAQRVYQGEFLDLYELDSDQRPAR